MRSLLPACFVIALAIVAPYGSSVLGQPPPPSNHYLTYEIAPPIMGTFTVTLIDQFKNREVTTIRLEQFANPVSKNMEPIVNPIAHLTWWLINQPEEPRRVIVLNQFGNSEWTLGNAQYLLAPALKNPDSPTEPLPNINHFKCYQANGQPPNQQVTLFDQFRQRTGTVGPPRYFCTPCEKVRGTQRFPILDPVTHLACYEIVPPMPFTVPVLIRDQFIQNQVVPTQDRFLCVPSMKDFPTPTETSTWGRIKAIYSSMK
jgi:hypothetical protein